ncbi:hypothetical protein [Fibrella forsythiae]|uniref:Uncharacterized protein n=1 Tax=Fibrella forsythiae TaxID=2817061 RepID=A0ABS3JC25_9BACT|nr:hypothetical protein [Fibrella forsythiae]MBO0947558.1 hypothetical protein [Fibrella forsythiae]
MKSETIETLAEGQSETLGRLLFGLLGHVDDYANLEARISDYIERELDHSRHTSPLIAEPYTLAYFEARTKKFVVHLAGLYGRKALPALQQKYFGLFTTLTYAHLIAGLIDEQTHLRLTVDFAFVRDFMRKEN